MVLLYLLIIFLSFVIIFNRIYFFFNKQKIIFYDYFIKFIIFIIAIYVPILFFLHNFFGLQKNYIISVAICSLLSFLSIFFTISLKSYESPTVLIYYLLKKNKNYKQIISYLERKKIIEIRIKDLQKQKLIKIKSNKITLTFLGSKFAQIYSFFMNYFKITREG